jgi:hydroxymethylbilane synthase
LTGVIRIGTRGSNLALAQSRWAQAWLERELHLATRLVTIKTTGDRFVDRPVSGLGGKGVFVKEIEEALTAGAIDCAIHSMKDVPAELASGLVIAAIPPREDPRDVLISQYSGGFEQLPAGVRLGTSSLRRTALARALRPDIQVHALRGNVDTRLRKLDRGEVEALLLAAAGLRRLEIERPDVEYLNPGLFLPAIGQGALAIESRSDAIGDRLAALDHPETRWAVTAERAFMLRAGGSCRTPLAAYATVQANALEVRALIAAPDGSRVVRGGRSGPPAAAAALGSDLADELLGNGGAQILQALEAS